MERQALWHGDSTKRQKPAVRRVSAYVLDRSSKPNSVLSKERRSSIWADSYLSARAALLLSQARPCTEVRIWPFQPEIAFRTLYERASSLSASSVAVRTSRLTADGRYPLPCCRLASACVRTFLPKRTSSDRLNRSIDIIPRLSYLSPGP